MDILKLVYNFVFLNYWVLLLPVALVLQTRVTNTLLCSKFELKIKSILKTFSYGL